MIQFVLGIPDQEKPAPGAVVMVPTWVDALRRYVPRALTGSLLSGLTPALLTFGAADGSLTQSALVSWNGSELTVNADANGNHTLGRGKVGSFVASDTFGFAHFDHATLTGFGFCQVAAGDTYFNAASGRSLFLQTNNVTVATITAASVTLAQSLAVNTASGSALSMDLTDTALSRTVAVARYNSSATSHTSAGILDIISGATTSADILLRMRTSGVNRHMFYADGSASSTGTFTLSAAAGTTLVVSSTAQATAATASGCATFSGGVGIAKDLFVGGNNWCQNTGTTANFFIQNSTSGYTGVDGLFLQLDGVNANVWNGENGFMAFATNNAERMRIAAAGGVSLGTASPLTISSTTASTSPTTGALIVAGGIGSNGKIYSSDRFAVSGSSAGNYSLYCEVSGAGANPMFATQINGVMYWGAGGASATDITLQRGGAGLLNLNIGRFSLSDTTASTTTATGALVVAGGVGVGGALNIGSASVATGLTVTASTTAFLATVSDAGTTNTPSTFVIDHTSSGTPAAGFGHNLFFSAKSSTTNTQRIAVFQSVWADATHASRKGRMILYASDASNERECVRIEASGTAPMIGFLGAAAVARPLMAAASGSATRTTFDTTTVTTAQLAERVKALIDDLRAFGLEG